MLSSGTTSMYQWTDYKLCAVVQEHRLIKEAKPCYRVKDANKPITDVPSRQLSASCQHLSTAIVM